MEAGREIGSKESKHLHINVIEGISEGLRDESVAFVLYRRGLCQLA